VRLSNPASSAVVLIGTAEYDHADVDDVPSVGANLADLSTAFTDPKVWGVPPGNITLLQDVRSPVTVYGQLREAAGKTREDGLFLVYYAGHGFPHESDLMLGLREIDPQFPDENGLRYVKIRDAIHRATTLRRLVILDCCFAGRAGRELLDAGDAVRQIVNQAEIQTEKIGLMVAVGPNELAKAPLNDRNTAFTSALLQVIREGLAAPVPLLTVRTVAHEVMRRVMTAGHLRPEFRESNGAGDLPFIRNVHPGRRQPAPRQVPAPVSEPGRTLTGTVLTASAELTDWELRQAWILILRHDESGAIGVRLNRHLGELPVSLDGWHRFVAPPPRLFDGGPVARDGFIALVRIWPDATPPSSFTRVIGSIGAVPLTEAPSSVRDTIAELRVFRGYLGWEPGGLERLIHNGALEIRDVEPDRAVFARHPFDEVIR
jgi:putative AlgH/UPF0301 family transcriptional regulator